MAPVPAEWCIDGLFPGVRLVLPALRSQVPRTAEDVVELVRAVASEGRTRTGVQLALAPIDGAARLARLGARFQRLVDNDVRLARLEPDLRDEHLLTALRIEAKPTVNDWLEHAQHGHVRVRRVHPFKLGFTPGWSFDVVDAGQGRAFACHAPGEFDWSQLRWLPADQSFKTRNIDDGAAALASPNAPQVSAPVADAEDATPSRLPLALAGLAAVVALGLGGLLFWWW